jgi:sterol desaturase/sphingolipid hydroxylase (fatty acid hydroxylase superfamily)
MIFLNLLWAIVVVSSISWLNDYQIGLFYLIEAPTWIKLVLGVAMFDFVFYWFHRMSHTFPFLWRFHRVHHSDVFLTPNLHRVHHDQDQRYTDSNYADVFILWDRLFGTYQYKPTEQIKYGLKEFSDPKQETFWYLIKSPFLNITRSNEPNKGANN